MIYGDDDRFYYLGQTSAKQNSEKIAVGVLAPSGNINSSAASCAARENVWYRSCFSKISFSFFPGVVYRSRMSFKAQICRQRDAQDWKQWVLSNYILKSMSEQVLDIGRVQWKHRSRRWTCSSWLCIIRVEKRVINISRVMDHLMRSFWSTTSQQC